MVGVILCGGKSSRMNADKGLLRFQQNTWAAIADRKLAELQLNRVFSINYLQQAAYAAALPNSTLIVDDADLNVNGPLSGILSVHNNIKKNDLLVLACDMLLMETEVLTMLLAAYTHFPEKDLYCFAQPNFPEPLCAIYKASFLKKIYNMSTKNELKRHSLQYVISLSEACILPIKDDFVAYFKNFNAEADIDFKI